MGEALVAFIRKRYRQSHEMLFQLVEGLTEEEWSWRPTPAGHNIAFQTWHSARFFDYVQTAFAKVNPDRQGRSEPARQIWQTEELAGKWHLDPAKLGEDESGYNMDDATAAALSLPEKAVVLDYARRTSAAALQALDALSDAQVTTLRMKGWAGELPVAGYVVEYMSHDDWVLGTISALRRAQGLPRVIA